MKKLMTILAISALFAVNANAGNLTSYENLKNGDFVYGDVHTSTASATQTTCSSLPAFYLVSTIPNRSFVIPFNNRSACYGFMNWWAQTHTPNTYLRDYYLKHYLDCAVAESGAPM